MTAMLFHKKRRQAKIAPRKFTNNASTSDFNCYQVKIRQNTVFPDNFVYTPKEHHTKETMPLEFPRGCVFRLYVPCCTYKLSYVGDGSTLTIEGELRCTQIVYTAITIFLLNRIDCLAKHQEFYITE